MCALNRFPKNPLGILKKNSISKSRFSTYCGQIKLDFKRKRTRIASIALKAAFDIILSNCSISLKKWHVYGIRLLSIFSNSPIIHEIYYWLRYVDDTFTAVLKDGIDDFQEHLNRQNADIQFTKEIEENGKIPFLDYLVTRENNRLRTTIYRKPTHTDRLLDQSSSNPTSHKATTILLRG